MVFMAQTSRKSSKVVVLAVGFGPKCGYRTRPDRIVIASERLVESSERVQGAIVPRSELRSTATRIRPCWVRGAEVMSIDVKSAAAPDTKRERYLLLDRL